MDGVPCKIRVSVFGPLRLSAPDGSDLTPRSMKARALLAVLLMTPGHAKSRRALQDRLWASSDRSKGSASLRQTLTEIRRALGDWRDLLRSDTRMVELDPSMMAVDLDARSAGFVGGEVPVLLEDIALAEPGFADWLAAHRRAHVATPATSGLAGRGNAARFRPVLRPFARARDGSDAFHATSFVEGVARSIAEWGPVHSYPTRENAQHEDGGSARDFVIDAAELSSGNKVALQVQFFRADDRSVFWRAQHVLDREAFFGGAEQGLALAQNQGLGSALHRLFEDAQLRRGDRGAQPDAFAAIHDMFRTLGREHQALQKELEACYEEDRRGIHLAWLAFLSTYSLGERRSVNMEALREEARANLRRAMEQEPNNSMCLALASFVHGLLLGEPEVARELAGRAVKANPRNALAWTFLGAAEIYLGDYAAAYRHTSFAQSITGEGVYRYLVDMLVVAAAALAGYSDRAIAVGEAVHAAMPTYTPPLRYMLAVHAKNGNRVAARRVMAKLQRLEPDFVPDMMADPSYPMRALQQARYFDTNLPIFDLD
ncbi:MAG: hypothetical protein HUJ27_09990 [Rhodobacteraceae bacterium]|nr:hypothetical protein [Paracoccaceae bacterium]